jgi:hypothetical protein
MKRLLERDDLAGAETTLAELFHAEPAFREDPFRKRRIGIKLGRPGFTHRRWLVMRPLFAGLLISGAAVGALGSGFFTPDKRPAAIVDALPAEPILPAPAPVLRRGVGTVPAVVTEPPVAAVPTAPAASPALRAPELPRAIARTSAPYPPGEDPSGVVRAIVALRNEKDPQRARTLLNQYLQKNPAGSLSEDALALSIEAASRAHDPRGAALARKYLDRYPQGRYRAFAQKALREK